MNRCTRPRSTRGVTRDGTHSSSMGREAGRPTQVASSLSENAASNTPLCPAFPARGEMPWSTALPDSAWVTGKSSAASPAGVRSEEHTSELQSPCNLVCRLLLEKKKKNKKKHQIAYGL